MAAETYDGGLLREAAEKKNDESILTHIRGKDCVAIEVKYHKSCHLNYCRYLTRPALRKGRAMSFTSKARMFFVQGLLWRKLCSRRRSVV